MDTVELQGLSYNADLQDKTSGFSLVLSATLKAKVWLLTWQEVHHIAGHKLISIGVFIVLQIKNIFTASGVASHFIDCQIVAYG